MLSEEEKKSIDKLKKIREDTIKANECGLSNNDFKEEIEVYNVVLNLITKLQKENEELKKALNVVEKEKGQWIEENEVKDKQIKDLQSRKDNQEKRFKKYKENIDKQHEEIYENLVSEQEKYKYLYQKALDNTVSADKENLQLKNQIDLMAEYIDKEELTEIFCNGKIICERNCTSCVKQYFETKAKGE